MMDLTLLYDASVVVDNNVLQDFAELGRMNLLFKVFKNISIPETIYYIESEDFVKKNLAGYEYTFCSLDLDSSMVLFAELTKNYKGLSIYDKQVVAIACQFDYYAGSNDGLVRRACEEFGIKYTGTLGIIGCAFQKNFINKDEFISLIDMLKSDKTTCYIKGSVINAFLEHVDIKIHIEKGGENHGEE